MISTGPAIGDPSRFGGTWVLEPAKTRVTFRAEAMWVLPVNGAATALSSDAQIDPGSAAGGSPVIDAASPGTAKFNTTNNKPGDRRSEPALTEPGGQHE